MHSHCNLLVGYKYIAHQVVYCFQSASRRHQRQTTLVPGEVSSKVASQEERAQEQLLRAVTAHSEPSSAFTHTLTQGSLGN